MTQFLNCIREADEPVSRKKQVLYSLCVLAAGAALGVFSKYLDCKPSNELPGWMSRLDITNFLGRFAIWIFLAVCIAVYSRSAWRAAVNVFVFFIGMVVSYYLYSKFVAGFFPLSYAAIWAGFTLLSPFAAFVCWYAKGRGLAAIVVSAGILAVLFNLAFAYGMIYFDVRYGLELFIFALALLVLRRNARETAAMAVLAVLLALVMRFLSPFRSWFW